MRNRAWRTAVAALWIASVGLAWWLYTRYEFGEGELAAAPLRWPASTSIRRNEQRPQVLVFIHPRCPCSRATLTALAEEMKAAKSPVELHILFLRPRRTPSHWARTELWDQALAIPGAEVREDIDGAEAACFGARTSGQVLYYDSAGALRLATGVTLGRGHVGDNAGQWALHRLLAGERNNVHEGVVFGCPLHSGSGVAARSRSNRT